MLPTLSDCEARARCVHHMDIGPVLVEIDLVPLPCGMLADEREKPEVPFGVSLHDVVSFEVERREVAMVVLHAPLASTMSNLPR